ncbi:glyoxalase [Solemya pervernicosa gill symbiont]|uniref:Glyoxalase n=2 Tax=Gammaproteobacteria incertae sedis TaxID=118884 RepID=A0A1T2L557_9GAMM|nr:VOC family protein [Candidatus Reidiella endopervernicosa]OOZ40170.1 glyoxalase [Solemya pervernicosa gill symbiont]QKQ25104.1 VOC family protein [Candidatus Reidiella endopervernicosa]
MSIKSISTAFTTKNLDQCRDFYTKYFDATITFDSGQYLNLEFGDRQNSLQFMKPMLPQQPFSSGGGLMYNIEVEDVDAEHQRLSQAGLEAVMAIEDHPWGDRGFAVRDPNGILLYINSPREPSEEFKQHYK